jgi:hypothetical protein
MKKPSKLFRVGRSSFFKSGVIIYRYVIYYDNSECMKRPPLFRFSSDKKYEPGPKSLRQMYIVLKDTGQFHSFIEKYGNQDMDSKITRGEP